MTMPGRRILFADDDVLTQWVMTEVLIQTGFGVVNACRGAEARALLQGVAPFDLLLTEVDLPGTTRPCELGELWRVACPGAPVIYTGVQSHPVTRSLPRNAYYLPKPFGAGRLLQLIDWALEDAAVRPVFPVIASRLQYVH